MLTRGVTMLALLLSACNSGSPGSADEPARENPTHAVIGTADLPADVRIWVDGRLGELAAESREEGRVLSGELFPLTSDWQKPRVLLLGLGTPYGRDGEVVFILLDEEFEGSMSSPFPIGLVHDEYNLGPVSVVDADGDGLLDLAYCTWPTSSPESQIDIIGYRRGWYDIEAAVELECGLRGSP